MQLNLNHFKHIVTLCELDSKSFLASCHHRN